MTNEEKQLLLKDLCARLPYGVVVQITSKHSVILGDGNESDKSDEPYNVSLTIGDCDSLIDFFNGDWVIGIKPYLRPILTMSEDEERELNQILTEVYDFTFKMDELMEDIRMQKSIPFKVYDWLNKHYFDYRGLIPMGLALPATEDMYH